MKLLGLLLWAALLLAPGFAAAQTAPPVEPERCPRLVSEGPWLQPAPPIVPAAFSVADAESGEVRLTFLGHSTFWIESPAGVTIATDYNDYLRPPKTPDIATMNRAHDTHYSRFPDPKIKYLLPGWRDDGQPAKYELTIGDVWLRNVTTDIRDEFGTGWIQNANSMFVFEVAGLCIAHLGHLHHILTRDHLTALGRIDVVLAPVDGSLTITMEGMLKVLQDLGAPVVIPMHAQDRLTLERFLSRVSQRYEIKRLNSPTVALSRQGLPRTPTVLVLPGI